MEKKVFFFLVSFILLQFHLCAQKLPNKQETTLRAPAVVKIDGLINEWNNQFQAFNHATEIYYTIANDDHYLYFIAKATNAEIINKLYSSGLQLIITTEDKRDRSEFSVLFPRYENNDLFHVNLRMIPKIVLDSPLTVQKADSFVVANNKKLSIKAKWIEVTGGKGLDSLVSVYNNDGIKAAAAFNSNMEYVVEFAIDLKHIKSLITSAGKLKYHVISNGLGRKTAMDNVVFTQTNLPNGSKLYTPDVPIDMNFMHKMETAHATTDFWGEYTLAK